MKRSKLFYLLGLLVVFAMVSISCTKEGPAGPAGADGQDGADGTDGTPGVDANTHCLNCHTAGKMDTIHMVLGEHPHVTGSSWARGTSESCGRCHSHDGYVEFARSGEAIAAVVSTHLECATCHGNHASLEEDIGAPMRDPGPVVAVVDETGGTVWDYEAANLCATCHQARRDGGSYDNLTEPETFTRNFTGDDIAVYQNAALGPNGSATLNATEDTLTVVFDVPLTHVYISSTHAGPHHGPQANMIAGISGYPEIGPVFDQAHHQCVNCHMHNEVAPGYGHSFAPNIEMCNECHGDAVDIEGLRADIMERMAVVEEKLEELHAIHVDEDGAVHPMYASLERDHFVAFWNFMYIWEDKSYGPHNPAYVEQMLSTAEANLAK